MGLTRPCVYLTILFPWKVHVSSNVFMSLHWRVFWAKLTLYWARSSLMKTLSRAEFSARYVLMFFLALNTRSRTLRVANLTRTWRGWPELLFQLYGTQQYLLGEWQVRLWCSHTDWGRLHQYSHFHWVQRDPQSGGYLVFRVVLIGPVW